MDIYIIVLSVVIIVICWLAYEMIMAPLMPDDYNLSDEERNLYNEYNEHDGIVKVMNSVPDCSCNLQGGCCGDDKCNEDSETFPSDNLKNIKKSNGL